jgi:hypothetical protein
MSRNDLEIVGWITETIDSRDGVRGRLFSQRAPMFVDRDWVRPVFAEPLPEGWEDDYSRWTEPEYDA